MKLTKNMDRLKIDEIIEHCERKTATYEKLNEIKTLENADLSATFIREYWEHRQVAGYLKELKELKGLEESGKLLKIPCAVGDTVYRIIAGIIEPCTVKVIFLTGDRDENGNQQYMMGLHYNREDCLFISGEAHSSYIGKTIFLTREEAENELRRNGGST